MSTARGRILSQYWAGNFGLHVHSPAIRCFLKILISRSAALRRWRWRYELILDFGLLEGMNEICRTFAVQDVNFWGLAMVL